jgi:hypothetical protein
MYEIRHFYQLTDATPREAQAIQYRHYKMFVVAMASQPASDTLMGQFKKTKWAVQGRHLIHNNFHTEQL